MRDVVIMASAAAWRGRTTGLVIACSTDRPGMKAIRCSSGTVDLRVLGGVKIRVFPDTALHCLILLHGRLARAACVRL